MGLRPNEISALIKEQIKHYDDIIEQKDVGTVVTVGDGVSVIHGLDNAMLGELLLFPNDVYGMVMNLDEDSVGAVLLGSESTIKEGDEVKRTGRIIEVPVGDEMLGRVVNPLGQAIDGQGEINTGKTKPIERVASGVMTRKSVDQPLQTGITSIDAIIPIGKVALRSDPGSDRDRGTSSERCAFGGRIPGLFRHRSAGRTGYENSDSVRPAVSGENALPDKASVSDRLRHADIRETGYGNLYLSENRNCGDHRRRYSTLHRKRGK